MTVDDEDVSGDSFRGLMKSLNLDETQFKSYRTDFALLDFQQLSTTKEDIESQLSILFDVLKNKYGADMNTKLVTRDGFPRSDIDVVSIRLIRVKVIRLRNDHKQILELLNDKLIEEFANRRAAEPQTDTNDVQTSQATESRQEVSRYTVPFALVKDVADNGPAYTSGLRDGDKIIVFDEDIHAANHGKLANVVSRVRNSINKSVKVDVLRGTERLVLDLKPTPNWGGQGVLGCRLVAL
ncbi:putative 26S proteasome regulatory subunit [Scheffersomyces xylosifermentans]|uniref:putative 26S proteasome regulatory subunit n=1 Tax=Scheffersomyces xylosifermentans TaxID=1304137 RepID=UPI00315D2649